jgi:hypothetical protein
MPVKIGSATGTPAAWGNVTSMGRNALRYVSSESIADRNCFSAWIWRFNWKFAHLIDFSLPWA